MTNQMALILTAATVGFVAAIFFCVGNVLNSPSQITAQATPYWDFSEPLARSLAAQRAQYVIGALLLLVSFGLQIAATQASATTSVSLPQLMQPWLNIVLVVFLSTSLIAGGCSYLLYKSTIKEVLVLGKKQ